MRKQYAEPADIKVYVRDKGVVVKEKSLLALKKGTNEITAIGTKVEQMAQNPNTECDIISPFHQGLITDFSCAQKILMYVLGKAGKKINVIFKPDMVICILKTVDEVQKRAYEEALLMSGAKKVILCTEPFESMIEHREDPDMKTVKYIIGITKDEPCEYIKEAISEVMEAAREQGLDKEWVLDYIEKKKE